MFLHILYQVSEFQYVFYTYSTVLFGLATPQVLYSQMRLVANVLVENS